MALECGDPSTLWPGPGTALVPRGLSRCRRNATGRMTKALPAGFPDGQPGWGAC